MIKNFGVEMAAAEPSGAPDPTPKGSSVARREPTADRRGYRIGDVTFPRERLRHLVLRTTSRLDGQGHVVSCTAFAFDVGGPSGAAETNFSVVGEFFGKDAQIKAELELDMLRDDMRVFMGARKEGDDARARQDS